MTEIDRYEIGVLTAKVAALEADMAALDKRLDTIEDRLGKILEKLSAAGGAWRVIVIFGTVAATIGGLMVAVLAWAWPRP